MQGVRSHNPTNKDFKTHFQGLASTKTKKGHLNDQDRKSDDKQSAEGELIRIIREKVDSNGWEVSVGKGSEKKKYMCSDSRGGLLIPDSNISDNGLYYIPKEKTEVEIDIDKKSKIYTITRIKSSHQIPLASFGDKIYLSTDTNTKTNQDVNATLTMTKDDINLEAEKVTITTKDVKIDIVESVTKQNTKISELEKTNQTLLERIRALEAKQEDVTNEETTTDTENNDSGESGDES